MADWPGNPVASMTVTNWGGFLSGGTSSALSWSNSLVNSQKVNDIQILWTISCDFDDHPNFDNGRGFFRARLFRLSDSGSWDQVDSNVLTLGNDEDDGHWSGLLRVRATMVREIEVYRIELYCETQDTSLGTNISDSKQFTAIQGSAFIGNFTMDYMPVSIVYCPPNQDMTASLSQSLEYGTRMTIGTSERFQASTSTSVDVAALGVKMGGVGVTDSHSVENRTEAGIEISYFRNTVLTADNQRAIGRAYWGPLGDIFVIAVNPRFAVDRRADGTLFYSNTGMDQLVVVPAYKLLRPGNDPVVLGIPADVRRRVLALDPFITNLDRFFPDAGAPLAEAANPYADPSPNNRAERLGRWWLNDATELNYSIGEAKALKSGEATETQFQSTVTVEAGFGINLFDIIGIGVQVGNSFTTSIGLQSSRETMARSSRTAACYLIRNQNEKDLDAIEIYFDKLFSTLMFRKIPARKRCISGIVTNVAGAHLDRLHVALLDGDGTERRTMTDPAGSYTFMDVEPGKYLLRVGDQEREVEIADDQPPEDPEEDDARPAIAAGPAKAPPWLPGPCIDLQLDGVRRVVNLVRSPAWEIVQTLGLTSDAVARLGRYSERVFDEADLAYLGGTTRELIGDATGQIVVEWPKTPLTRLSDLSDEEAATLEQRGVDSLQQLWRRTRTSRNAEALSEETGIAVSRLRGWQAEADRKRASIARVGSPPIVRAGCLGWLLRVLPLPGLRRRLEFQASKQWQTLFGTPAPGDAGPRPARETGTAPADGG
jgi:Carboxypeptidase regulatory-like domain